MIRKNFFYISLVIIYLFYLTKTFYLGLPNNIDDINNYLCTVNNENNMENYEALLSITNINYEPLNIIYSKVIRRDIYEFNDKIIINKGKKENIKKGDIVVNELGVIGIVNEAFNHSSEISLITNNKTNISVKVRNSYGILNTTDHKLIVKNLKIEETIEEGDVVFTSGLTKIPENLKIGTVRKINKDNLELEYILDIDNLNMHNIKYVGVISL